MKWVDKYTKILEKTTITQEDYDEFIKFGKTLKSDNELDVYQQLGEGIHLLASENPNIKLADDEF